MIFFTSKNAIHKLTFIKLSHALQFLPIAAKWAEDEWGYIRNKGVQFREDLMRELRNDIYIGLYAGVPVAMFALFSRDFDNKLLNPFPALELMYVYVRKEFRGLGFGNQIILEARKIAKNTGARSIILDTLKPSLNRLYEKQGANLVCENHLFSHPTDVLRMGC